MVNQRFQQKTASTESINKSRDLNFSTITNIFRLRGLNSETGRVKSNNSADIALTIVRRGQAVGNTALSQYLALLLPRVEYSICL